MGTTSDIEVCNLALDHIGKANITSFTENTLEARKCRVHYTPARQAVLAKTDWTFARKSQKLAQLTVNDFDDVWDYAYDMPNDVLTVKRVLESGGIPNANTPPMPSYIESGVVYTNVPEARMFYVRDSADVTSWSPLFIDAVALKLAVRLAPSMTRKKSDVADLAAQYEHALQLAEEHDAAQEVTTYRYGDGYADARGGGSAYGDTGRQTDGSNIWSNT